MRPNFKNIDIKNAGFAATNAAEWAKANGIEANWKTPEHIEVKPVYTKEDLEGMEHLNYASGLPPYLRGPYSGMYAMRPWTIRQYAGFSTAEESNAFYRRNLASGHRRWRGTFLRADPAATRNSGASRRNISCAAHRAACESPPRFRPDRHKRGTCCFSLCRWLPQARQAYDNCPRSRLPLFYLTLVNILFQRMFAGKLFSGSSDSQMKEALPTMWSSGTNPQKRESAELWRLSPIIQ